jgi:hypothetical protein
MRPRDRLEADPVTELHRYRRELSKRFTTVEELAEYYNSIPSPEELLADLRKKIVEKRKRPRKNKQLVGA